MIDHMHEKLLRWADWAGRGGLAPGLWYARCTFGNEGGGASITDPVLDRDSGDVDKAVTLLPGELKQVVRVYYLGSGTARQKARDCQMCVQTMYVRLHHAQQRLAGSLDEMRKDRRAWPVKSTLAETR